jgi:hypothetical protein
MSRCDALKQGKRLGMHRFRRAGFRSQSPANVRTLEAIRTQALFKGEI